MIKHRALSKNETTLEVPSNQHTDIVPLLSKSHPLLRYAFNHGFHHIQFLEPRNRAVIDGMISLRSDIERHPVEWRLISKLATLSPPYPSKLPPAAQHDFIICVLISSLPESFLRAFLRQARFKAFDGTSPLIYATYFHKIEHARTILSRRVSQVNTSGLDVECPCQVLPLEAALHYQHHDLFDLFLLDWGATIPPRLFFSVFYKGYLCYNPRDATILLQCDEFAEWVVDGHHGQSLLHALGNTGGLLRLAKSTPEKVVVTLLRRLSQAVPNFFGPGSLEFVLGIILDAESRKSFSVLQHLCSLDVPIPSRALSIGRTELIQTLTRHGHDVNAIMTRGNVALYHALGECKHGSSCWTSDCNSCSPFLRAINPDVSQIL